LRKPLYFAVLTGRDGLTPDATVESGEVRTSGIEQLCAYAQPEDKVAMLDLERPGEALK
jgi:hypothetical protein